MTHVTPEEHSLFSPLLILFLCLFYILIMLPIRLNKIYRKSVVGHPWVEMTPEGLVYDRAEQKKEIAWEEVAGVALYKDYCFLYDKGGEFLLVTSDERVKESLLYYLNARKVK